MKLFFLKRERMQKNIFAEKSESDKKRNEARGGESAV